MIWLFVVAGLLWLLVILVAFALKRLILRAIPIGIHYVQVSADVYPALDHAALERYTWHFSALGFVEVGDYRLEADEGIVQPGFARLFVHPEDGCYAEVNQIFPEKGDPTPMRSLIGTLFEDGWSLATSDRNADGIIYTMRQPRGVWRSLPEATPPELYYEHKLLREMMVQRLGVSPKSDTSRDAYVEHERAEAIARREVIRRKNGLVSLAEIAFFPLRPKSEWLGELGSITP